MLRTPMLGASLDYLLDARALGRVLTIYADVLAVDVIALGQGVPPAEMRRISTQITRLGEDASRAPARTQSQKRTPHASLTMLSSTLNVVVPVTDIR